MGRAETQTTDGTTARSAGAPLRYAPAGALDHVPTQRTGPRAPAPAPRRRTAAVLVGFGAVVVLVAASAVVQQQRADAAEQQHAVQARTAAALAALASDTGARDDITAAGTAELTAARTALTASTTAALAHANGTLGGAVHVGDDLRAPLQNGIVSVSAILGGGNVSLAALRAGELGLTGADQAAANGEQAWQAADAARVAAEQAQQAADAAVQAAAQAAQQAARQSTRSTTRTTTRSSAPVVNAPAPAGPVGIPAGGLVCPGAPTGTPGSESSIGDIGAAINAYRASNGLPSLSVSRSGTLVAHAEDMADAGGIWHSGFDNIVGCISNGSASALVGAWSRSPSHNAQMLRTDVSSMAVGGAVAGGWLYGAVKFN